MINLNCGDVHWNLQVLDLVNKKKYMEFCFSGREEAHPITVKLGGEVVPISDIFAIWDHLFTTMQR